MWEQEQEQEDMFSAIDGASVKGQRLPYLEYVDERTPGMYVVEIESIKAFRSRSKRLFYIAEVVIIESNVETRPPGMKCSWMTDLGMDMGPINVKRFLGALCGLVDEDQIDEEVTSDIARLSANEKEQPFTETRAAVQVRHILTKGKKEDFSEHRWEPCYGHTLDDILERRKARAETAPV